MTRWRRLDPKGLTYAITLVFLVIGGGFAVVGTVGFLAGGRWQVNPLVGMLAFYGLTTVWLGFVWRMNRAGIYVNDEAVRVVYPWRTRVIPWTDVAEFSRAPAMVGRWATVRDAIWLTLRDGTRVETSIQCHSARVAGLRKNIGPVLSPHEFDALLDALRAASARGSRCGRVRRRRARASRRRRGRPGRGRGS